MTQLLAVTPMMQLAALLKGHREAAILGALNLEPDDLALVAGGYKGETVGFLRELYDCHVATYEPQAWAVRELLERFGNDDKVYIRPYALGVTDDMQPMYEFETDACSFLPIDGSRQSALGQMREAVGLLHELYTLPRVVVLNIEGYEYALLDHLHKADLIRTTQYWIIQFHRASEMCHERSRTLTQLADSHDLLWATVNWECWVKR